MDWIRLNVFQRLTRHWDSLHPYNAAQVMKLQGPGDIDTLTRSWREALSELGLARLQVDGRYYRWQPNDPWQPQRLLTDVPAGTSIDQFMSQELNRRFDNTAGQPFSAFVIREEESHYAGVVYHHWVADSYAIRLLLREWLLRMYDPAAARRTPLRTAHKGYWGLFGPRKAGWDMGSSIFTMVRWGTRFGKARRINARSFEELSASFTVYRGPEGLIDQVAAAARRQGATVNDVFLAAMGKVCQEMLPLDSTPWRRELALGTIVDLRGRSGQSLDETFGLFLGFTTVFCGPEELGDWHRLLRQIHQQIQLQNQSRSAEASMMRMVGALAVARMFRREKLLEFYRKRFGMTAGISNVNLNRDWPARFYPSPLQEYIRVSPCGPLMPVVFTPTTLGKSLNVGLTARRALVTPQRMTELAARFIEYLKIFAESEAGNLPT